MSNDSTFYSMRDKPRESYIIENTRHSHVIDERFYHKQTDALDTVSSGNVGMTVESPTDCTSSTFPTDANHLTVTPGQGTAIENVPPVDYLGLQEDSSSPPLSETNSIKLQVGSKRGYPSDVGPSYQNEELVEHPQTKFWCNESKPEKWNQPETIWNTFNDSKALAELDKKNHTAVSDSPQTLSEENASTYHQTSDAQPAVIENENRGVCFKVKTKISEHMTLPLHAQIPSKIQLELAGHNGAVNRADWCPGEHSHLLCTVGMDRTVKIWDTTLHVHNALLRSIICHDKAVRDCSWSRFSKSLLTCSYDRTTQLIDVEKAMALTTFLHHDYVSCLQYHPIDPHIFIAGSKNRIFSWDVRAPLQPVQNYAFKDYFGRVQDILFLPDGNSFITCNDVVARDNADKVIMAWDYKSGAVLSNQMYHERFTCTRLRHHPTKPMFGVQSQGNHIALFNNSHPYKMDQYKKYDKHKVKGFGVGFDFSPDGRYIVSASADSKLYYYDYTSARIIHSISTGLSVNLDVAWHPVLANTVAVTSNDGMIQVWN